MHVVHQYHDFSATAGASRYISESSTNRHQLHIYWNSYVYTE